VLDVAAIIECGAEAVSVAGKAAVAKRAAETEDQAAAADTHPRPARAEPDGPIKVVTSELQRALLIAAPVGAAIVLALFARDPMLASGLVTVIAAFVVFYVFISRIPDAFVRLATRKVIDSEAVDGLVRFETAMEASLNDWRAVAVCAVCAVFGVARFPVQDGGIAEFARHLDAGGPLFLLNVIAEAAIGFIVGLVAWRMLVVGWSIRRLGDAFVLRIQLGHPDGCGGFRPLGELCLWNALLVTVPAMFLGFWVVLAPKFGYDRTYVGLQTTVLGVLLLLATVTFLAPLWSVHLAMQQDAKRLRQEVDEVGQTIDRLSRELLARADELTPDESEKMTRDLEIQQQIYHRNEQIPTWPIDVRLAVKFSAAQVVPLLGFTGLSKPIVDLVASMLKALNTG
jgi:hypothetical protein